MKELNDQTKNEIKKARKDVDEGKFKTLWKLNRNL